MSKQDLEDGYKIGYKIGFKEGIDQSWHKWNEGYVKDLTDEEIEQIAGENYLCLGGQPLLLVRFARALLKKASEK